MGFDTCSPPPTWATAASPSTGSPCPTSSRSRRSTGCCAAARSRRRSSPQVALVSSHAPWVPVPALLRLGARSATGGSTTRWRCRATRRRWSGATATGCATQYRQAIDYSLETVFDYAARHAAEPPLMLVLGDHQAAGFVALDDRPDVPIHVIGPPDADRALDGWGWTPGLVPEPRRRSCRWRRCATACSPRSAAPKTRADPADRPNAAPPALRRSGPTRLCRRRAGGANAARRPVPAGGRRFRRRFCRAGASIGDAVTGSPASRRLRVPTPQPLAEALARRRLTQGDREQRGRA